ncbi:MAG: fimbrillin family protein, partial [Eubacteriales bacterium]|nr:fimbrillin family protein [Eubacteriales bacterium]
MKKRGKQLFSLLLALTVTLGTLPATAFAAVGDIPTEDYKGSVHVGDEFDPGTTISVYCYGDDDETYAQYSPDVTFLTKVGDTAWPTSSAIEEDYSEYDNPLTFSPVYDAATEGTDTGYVATESYLYSGDDPDSSDNIEFYYLMLQKDTDRSSANSYYDYYTPVGLCYRSNEVFVQLTGEPYTTAVNNYNGVADSKKSGSNYNYFIHLPAAENQYEGVTAWVATKVDGRGDITFTAKTASYDPMDHMPWDYYGDTGWYYNAGGDATHYTISTAAELAGLAKLCNETEEPLFAGKTVKLGDDIDLSAHDWTPISFYGDYDGEIATFDGDGHSITGLSVKQGNFFFEGTCAGLFAGAADATLQNFTVSGEVYVTDCEVVGGVVGELYDATLVNVGSTVNVSASLAGGSVFAGGLAGFASGARILNCYALGDVSADASLNEVSTYNVPTPRAYAGGAAGALLDSVAFNCYHAVGTVSATGKEQGYGGIAGLVGSGTNSLDDPDPVTNCYSTTQNSAEDDHADGAFIDADKKVGDSSLMFKLNQKTGTAQPSEYSDVTFATWRCMSQYAWPTHEPQYGAEYSTDGGSTWTKCAKLGDILGKFDTGTAAQNKVRLLADDISSLIVPYSFTLDLQGHKWTASSVDSAPLTMSGTSGGEIVITDSVGGGKIIGADADATHAATSAIYVGGSRYDTSQTTSTAKLTLTGDKPFTIQGGQGLAESNNEQYRAGAPGIDVRNGGTLTVDVGANVTIQGGDSGALPSSSSGNYGTAGGAGVAVQSGSALQAGGGTFIGGDGGAGGSSKSGNGGAGVSAADSAAAVEITGGTFTGGTGGANASGIFGGDGGIGAYVSGGSFSASGGMFTGGTGGAGGTTTSGDGGDGLSLVDGVTSGPLSGLTCAGGTGGANTSGLFSGNGGDGLSLMNGVTSGPLSGLTCAGGAGGT